MRLTALFLSLAVAAPLPLLAQNVTPDMVCFYEAPDGQMIDLEGWCGKPPVAAVNSSGGGISIGGGGSSGGGGGSGGCDSPNDRASDGSRCGDRAASERPGGR